MPLTDRFGVWYSWQNLMRMAEILFAERFDERWDVRRKKEVTEDSKMEWSCQI